MTRLLAIAAIPMLAACAATTAPLDPDLGDLPERPAPMGDCDVGGAQDAIGQRATGELGSDLLVRSGARVLRWGPPGMAFTMDYRQDRLNVVYDHDYAITAVRCG